MCRYVTEMVDSISVTKKKVSNIVMGSWVRMRNNVYKGDLARVIDTNYADNQCTVGELYKPNAVC